ncbi:MAG: enoyl-CoA hydratase/isomerase family protein, partial [Burkholderiaceae bacterium]|nr:enoyl-CoA hydratase/isomerase family protein [Burkholderiaceae bacterium]
MSDLILVQRDGAIATVVLNRPEKLNALTRPMWQQLGETIARLSADDSLRCIVLRGAGEKAFSPGNDISEFETVRANKAQAREYGKIMHATAQALAECRHPLVAQIHGICVGGGLEIAALCDIRICGQSSRFGAPIKNLGRRRAKIKGHFADRFEIDFLAEVDRQSDDVVALLVSKPVELS